MPGEVVVECLDSSNLDDPIIATTSSWSMSGNKSLKSMAKSILEPWGVLGVGCWQALSKSKLNRCDALRKCAGCSLHERSL